MVAAGARADIRSGVAQSPFVDSKLDLAGEEHLRHVPEPASDQLAKTSLAFVDLYARRLPQALNSTYLAYPGREPL